MSDNYYNILGVSPGVSETELTKAYKKRSFECHPDRAAANGLTVEEATEKFQKLQEAYKKLQEEIRKHSDTSSHFNSSNPDFWTEPISPEERKKTSEEAIQKIESHFASFGVTFDDLEIQDFPLAFFHSDWKTMMKNCFNRREFNVKYNQMLDAIEKAAARKKDKNFQASGEEEKNEEKKLKEGLPPKRKLMNIADKNNPSEDRNQGGSDGKEEKQPSHSETIFSSSNNQENRTVNNPSLNLENNNQNLSNNGQKKEVVNDKGNDKVDLPDLVLQGNYWEEQREKLEKLKQEFADLQNQQSGFQNEISKQSTDNNQQSNNNFPWLWVVIPMGAIILIFGGIILFLLDKKKN